MSFVAPAGILEPTDDTAWITEDSASDTLRVSSREARFAVSGLLGVRCSRTINQAGRFVSPPRTYVAGRWPERWTGLSQRLQLDVAELERWHDAAETMATSFAVARGLGPGRAAAMMLSRPLRPSRRVDARLECGISFAKSVDFTRQGAEFGSNIA